MPQVWSSGPVFPREIAEVQETFRGSSERTLYLLQDAHTNFSAQKNIASAIRQLVEKEKLRTVYVEGGFGDVSLAPLKKNSSPKKREELGMKYLRSGELSGAEYLNLAGADEFELAGVEDRELYWKSLELYRSVAKDRDKFKAYLDQVDRSIDTLKPEILHPLLRGFDRKRQDFLSGKLSFGEYFSALKRYAGWFDAPLSDYPELSKMASLSELEERIDFKAANEEAAKAARLVEERKPEAGKLTSRNAQNVEAFYALLEERLKASNSPNFPALTKYFEYLAKARAIKPADLLREQGELEAALLEKLAETPDEKKLLEVSDRVRQWKSLISLSILPNEFQALSGAESLDLRALTGFLNEKIMESEDHYDRVIFLSEDFEKALDTAEEFYALTRKRDVIFIERMLTRMAEKGESKAVLVAGGYHSPNLKALLKEKNVSFICVTPQILNETNISRYEKLLLGQANAPAAAKAPASPAGRDALAVLAVESRPADSAMLTGARLSQELAVKEDSPVTIAPAFVSQQPLEVSLGDWIRKNIEVPARALYKDYWAGSTRFLKDTIEVFVDGQKIDSSADVDGIAIPYNARVSLRPKGFSGSGARLAIEVLRQKFESGLEKVRNYTKKFGVRKTLTVKSLLWEGIAFTVLGTLSVIIGLKFPSAERYLLTLGIAGSFHGISRLILAGYVAILRRSSEAATVLRLTWLVVKIIFMGNFKMVRPMTRPEREEMARAVFLESLDSFVPEEKLAGYLESQGLRSAEDLADQTIHKIHFSFSPNLGQILFGVAVIWGSLQFARRLNFDQVYETVAVIWDVLRIPFWTPAFYSFSTYVIFFVGTIILINLYSRLIAMAVNFVKGNGLMGLVDPVRTIQVYSTKDLSRTHAEMMREFGVYLRYLGLLENSRASKASDVLKLVEKRVVPESFDADGKLILKKLNLEKFEISDRYAAMFEWARNLVQRNTSEFRAIMAGFKTVREIEKGNQKASILDRFSYKWWDLRAKKRAKDLSLAGVAIALVQKNGDSANFSRSLFFLQKIANGESPSEAFQSTSGARLAKEKTGLPRATFSQGPKLAEPITPLMQSERDKFGSIVSTIEKIPTQVDNRLISVRMLKWHYSLAEKLQDIRETLIRIARSDVRQPALYSSLKEEVLELIAAEKTTEDGRGNRYSLEAGSEQAVNNGLQAMADELQALLAGARLAGDPRLTADETRSLYLFVRGFATRLDAFREDISQVHELHVVHKQKIAIFHQEWMANTITGRAEERIPESMRAPFLKVEELLGDIRPTKISARRLSDDLGKVRTALETAMSLTRSGARLAQPRIILFDLDNVLIQALGDDVYGPELVRAVEEKFNVKIKDDAKTFRIKTYYLNDKEATYLKLQKGRLPNGRPYTAKDYLRELNKALREHYGVTTGFRDIKEWYELVFGDRLQTSPAIAFQLKRTIFKALLLRGFSLDDVGFISDRPVGDWAVFGPLIQRLYPGLFTRPELNFISYEFQGGKQDGSLFDIVTDHLKRIRRVRPDEILLIDDRPGNREQAALRGWQTIDFEFGQPLGDLEKKLSDKLTAGARLAQATSFVWNNPQPTTLGELTVFAIEEAATAQRDVVARTPLLSVDALKKEFGVPVYIKNEAGQFSGSFKMRGVYYQVYSTLKDILEREPTLLNGAVQLVTQSTGNHGIALVWAVTKAIEQLGREYPELAAKLRNVRPVVFSYKELKENKKSRLLDALSNYTEKTANEGALLDESADYEAARKLRQEYMKANAGTARYMDHGGPVIRQGHATMAKEMVEQLSKRGIGPDKKITLIIPVGEGGPLGIAEAMKLLWGNPDHVTTVIVQETKLAALVHSLQSGTLQTNPASEGAPQISDGIAVHGPQEEAFELAKKIVDAGFVIDEKEAASWADSVLSLGLGGTTILAVGAALKFKRHPAISGADALLFINTESGAEHSGARLVPNKVHFLILPPGETAIQRRNSNKAALTPRGIQQVREASDRIIEAMESRLGQRDMPTLPWEYDAMILSTNDPESKQTARIIQGRVQARTKRKIKITNLIVKDGDAADRENLQKRLEGILNNRLKHNGNRRLVAIMVGYEALVSDIAKKPAPMPKASLFYFYHDTEIFEKLGPGEAPVFIDRLAAGARLADPEPDPLFTVSEEHIQSLFTDNMTAAERARLNERLAAMQAKWVAAGRHLKQGNFSMRVAYALTDTEDPEQLKWRMALAEQMASLPELVPFLVISHALHLRFIGPHKETFYPESFDFVDNELLESHLAVLIRRLDVMSTDEKKEPVLVGLRYDKSPMWLPRETFMKWAITLALDPPIYAMKDGSYDMRFLRRFGREGLIQRLKTKLAGDPAADSLERLWRELLDTDWNDRGLLHPANVLRKNLAAMRAFLPASIEAQAGEQDPSYLARFNEAMKADLQSMTHDGASGGLAEYEPELLVAERNFGLESTGVAVEDIVEFQKQNPTKSANIVFATGNTMVPIYKYLVEDNGIDWSRVRTFQQDEYEGLGPEDEGSFGRFLEEHLYSKLYEKGLQRRNVFFMDASEPEMVIHYPQRIKDLGGIDFIFHGIGLNGHIAGNEPASGKETRMRLVELSPETVAANGVKPGTKWWTLGIADILEAKKIFLFANGSGKARSIRNALEGPISANLPASWLRTHSNVTFVFDPGAASLLAEGARLAAKPGFLNGMMRRLRDIGTVTAMMAVMLTVYFIALIYRFISNHKRHYVPAKPIIEEDRRTGARLSLDKLEAGIEGLYYPDSLWFVQKALTNEKVLQSGLTPESVRNLKRAFNAKSLDEINQALYRARFFGFRGFAAEQLSNIIQSRAADLLNHHLNQLLDLLRGLEGAAFDQAFHGISILYRGNRKPFSALNASLSGWKDLEIKYENDSLAELYNQFWRWLLLAALIEANRWDTAPAIEGMEKIWAVENSPPSNDGARLSGRQARLGWSFGFPKTTVLENPKNPVSAEEDARTEEIVTRLLEKGEAGYQTPDGDHFRYTLIRERTDKGELIRLEFFDEDELIGTFDVDVRDTLALADYGFYTDDVSGELKRTEVLSAIFIRGGYQRYYSGMGASLVALTMRTAKRLGAEKFEVRQPVESSLDFWSKVMARTYVVQGWVSRTERYGYDLIKDALPAVRFERRPFSRAEWTESGEVNRLFVSTNAVLQLHSKTAVEGKPLTKYAYDLYAQPADSAESLDHPLNYQFTIDALRDGQGRIVSGKVHRLDKLDVNPATSTENMHVALGALLREESGARLAVVTKEQKGEIKEVLDAHQDMDLVGIIVDKPKIGPMRAVLVKDSVEDDFYMGGPDDVSIVAALETLSFEMAVYAMPIFLNVPHQRTIRYLFALAEPEFSENWKFIGRYGDPQASILRIQKLIKSEKRSVRNFRSGARLAVPLSYAEKKALQEKMDAAILAAVERLMAVEGTYISPADIALEADLEVSSVMNRKSWNGKVSQAMEAAATRTVAVALKKFEESRIVPSVRNITKHTGLPIVDVRLILKKNIGMRDEAAMKELIIAKIEEEYLRVEKARNAKKAKKAKKGVSVAALARDLGVQFPTVVQYMKEIESRRASGARLAELPLELDAQFSILGIFTRRNPELAGRFGITLSENGEKVRWTGIDDLNLRVEAEIPGVGDWRFVRVDGQISDEALVRHYSEHEIPLGNKHDLSSHLAPHLLLLHFRDLLDYEAEYAKALIALFDRLANMPLEERPIDISYVTDSIKAIGERFENRAFDPLHYLLGFSTEERAQAAANSLRANTKGAGARTLLKRTLLQNVPPDKQKTISDIVENTPDGFISKERLHEIALEMERILFPEGGSASPTGKEVLTALDRLLKEESPSKKGARLAGSIQLYGAHDWQRMREKILSFRALFDESHRWPEEYYDRFYGNGDAIFVAYEEAQTGRLLGYGAGAPLARDFASNLDFYRRKAPSHPIWGKPLDATFQLTSRAVEPAARGNGLARRFRKELWKAAKEAGYSYVMGHLVDAPDGVIPGFEILFEDDGRKTYLADLSAVDLDAALPDEDTALSGARLAEARLGPQGRLWLGGGRPLVNGEKTPRPRAWFRSEKHGGEQIQVLMEDGLVTRVRSLESDLDVTFARVWSKSAQKYVASFYGRISKGEFNLLNSDHEIHGFELSKDGSLELGGREWMNFGPSFSYKRIDIKGIENPEGKQAFVTGAEEKKLSTISLSGSGPSDSFESGPLVSVFEKASKRTFQNENGQSYGSFIVKGLRVAPSGLLNIAGLFQRRFTAHKGQEVELKVIDGEPRYLRAVAKNIIIDLKQPVPKPKPTIKRPTATKASLKAPLTPLERKIRSFRNRFIYALRLRREMNKNAGWVLLETKLLLRQTANGSVPREKLNGLKADLPDEEFLLVLDSIFDDMRSSGAHSGARLAGYDYVQKSDLAASIEKFAIGSRGGKVALYSLDYPSNYEAFTVPPNKIEPFVGWVLGSVHPIVKGAWVRAEEGVLMIRPTSLAPSLSPTAPTGARLAEISAQLEILRDDLKPRVSLVIFDLDGTLTRKGSVELLQGLRKQGKKIVIVTGAYKENADETLEKYGITVGKGQLVDEIYEEAGEKKEAFSSIIRRSRLNSSEILSIGDGEHELHASASLGIPHIQLNNLISNPGILAKESNDRPFAYISNFSGYSLEIIGQILEVTGNGARLAAKADESAAISGGLSASPAASQNKGEYTPTPALRNFVMGTYLAFPTPVGPVALGGSIFSFQISGARLALLDGASEVIVIEDLDVATKEWKQRRSEAIRAKRENGQAAALVRNTHLQLAAFGIQQEQPQGFVGVDISKIGLPQTDEAFRPAVGWLVDVLAARGGRYYIEGFGQISTENAAWFRSLIARKKNFAEFTFEKPVGHVLVNIQFENGPEPAAVLLGEKEFALRVEAFSSGRIANLEAAVATAQEAARVYQNAVGKGGEETIQDIEQSKLPEILSAFGEAAAGHSRPTGSQLDAFFRGSLEYAQVWTIRPIQVFVRLVEALNSVRMVEISA